MAIGTVAGFVNSPGSSQTATPTATLPTITTAGYAVAFIGTNAGSTTTVSSAPSGWTPLDGPYDNASNNMRVWLYGKAVTSADSGATFSATLSLTSRWAVGGAVLPGASGVDVSVQWIDNTDDLSIDVPAITPTVADTYRMALVYDRSISGALTVTPPGGWNELGDVCSTNGSGARFGAWVGGVQLTGQAGVAQGIASAAYSTNARNSGWQLTIAPTATSEAHSGSVALSGSGVLSFAATVALSATLALTGSGGLNLTGQPTATGTLARTGSGTLTLTGAPSAAGALNLTGAGTLNLTGSTATTGTLALTGSGTLALSGSATQAGSGALNLTGSGSLALTGRPATTGSLGLAGSGTLGLVGSASQAGSATLGLSGTGTLSVTGTAAVAGTVTLTGGGTLTATAVPATSGALSLGGVGSLTLSGTGSQQGDGTPVLDPALALTTTAGALTLTVPDATLSLDAPAAALTVTTPPSTLELT